MHMADALVSPTVGGVVWVASVAAITYSSSRLRVESDTRMVPLMGVLGAFLFAAQMINFSIPGTGSSGHLGGGLLLAILLGPHASLLVTTSVLMVQALFFADGGLLALGCNIFNMGLIPSYLVYPLLYHPLTCGYPSVMRRNIAVILSALVTLQLGPFCVVLETVLSGISALPFSAFLLLMQPVHLAIGLVEGVVTASILSFVYQARPELLQGTVVPVMLPAYRFRTVLASFAVAACITGGLISLVASEKPDGLEWAIHKVTGGSEVKGGDTPLHKQLASLQEKYSLLPDYSFRKTAVDSSAPASGRSARLGTSLSGLVGGLLTLLLLAGGGFVLIRCKGSAEGK